MGIVEPLEGLEAQLELWRGYVARRRAISAADLDELEDHLREQIDERRASGLDDDEAFLVAIKRMGNLDAVSREFAREHSERLWKQLVLMPGTPGISGPGHGVELAVVLSLAIGAGLALKAGISWLGDDISLLKNVSLLVIPFVAAYFAWKRKVSWSLVAALGVAFAAVAVVLNLYPLARGGSTGPLAALHAPRHHLGPGGNRLRRRTLAEPRTAHGLCALHRRAGHLLHPIGPQWWGSGRADQYRVAVGRRGSGTRAGGLDPAFVVAGWLVEAKQDVIENIAPVPTPVFTPLSIVMLVAMLGVLSTSGRLAGLDRGLLIIINGVLVLVLCLVLYSLSAREPLAPAGLFDTLAAGVAGRRPRRGCADARCPPGADRRVREQPEQGRGTGTEFGFTDPLDWGRLAGVGLCAWPLAGRRRRTLADALSSGIRALGRSSGVCLPATFRFFLN